VVERKRIGLRDVRGLVRGEIVWDAAVAGFHARRQRGSAVTYAVFYRTKEGRQRWHKIGRHGAPWTPERAREEAVRILASVADGSDPAAEKRATRKATTIAELCDAYLADAEAGRLLTRSKSPKKRSTLAVDKGRIERHIKPLLGRLAVAAATREDIERFLHDAGRTAASKKTAKKRGLARVTGGRTAATRAVGLVGGIFTYAKRRRIRTDNPVHGVERFADQERNHASPTTSTPRWARPCAGRKLPGCGPLQLPRPAFWR
jgi:hypothetical protein